MTTTHGNDTSEYSGTEAKFIEALERAMRKADVPTSKITLEPWGRQDAYHDVAGLKLYTDEDTFDRLTAWVKRWMEIQHRRSRYSSDWNSFYNLRVEAIDNENKMIKIMTSSFSIGD